MDFYIFDSSFHRLGIIDVYESISIVRKYDNHSTLNMIVDANDTNSDLLLNNDDIHIITKATDTTRGYVIESAQYEDELKLRITIDCISLSSMTGWRIVDSQQRFSGNIEDVLKSFVKINAIQPTDPNRIIPNLILGPNSGIDITTDEIVEIGVPLDTALWEICKKHEVSFEILMDHTNKKYVVRTYKGTDRSSEQSINPRVIFAKKFDNVILQSYVDDLSNYRSTAYIVGGSKDDEERTVVKVNNNISGFNRREVYIEANDIQKSYTENDVEVIIPQSEFESLLNEFGLSKLSEYQRVRTFDSNINLYSRFMYDKHYFLGDIVTNRNDELGVVTHSRLINSTETYTREGYDLQIQFGTSIPTLIDKIKRKVKK